jgi:hypothetical protein
VEGWALRLLETIFACSCSSLHDEYTKAIGSCRITRWHYRDWHASTTKPGKDSLVDQERREAL